MATPARQRTAVRTSVRVLFSFFLLLSALSQSPMQAQEKLPPPYKAPRHPPVSAKLMSAKSIYFDNETGDSAVGRDALRELNEWGRFQVVNQGDAQLLIVLSTEEFTSDDFPDDLGGFDGSTLRLPRKPLNAFLTIIDRPTGDRLWIDSRPWGGLLTGANSAGRRLIARLRKHVEHQRLPS